MSLGDDLRKARESVLESGGHKITVRRPTDLQWNMWSRLPDDEFLRRIVVAYKGPASQQVNDRNRIDGQELFNSDAFIEWVGDQPDIIKSIIDHVLAKSTERAKAVGHNEKKS